MTPTDIYISQAEDGRNKSFEISSCKSAKKLSSAWIHIFYNKKQFCVLLLSHFKLFINTILISPSPKVEQPWSLCL